MTTSTPSEKQINFLTKLAAERAGNAVAAEAMAQLNAGTLERKACSNFIDQLLATPKTKTVVPAGTPAVASSVATPAPGTYTLVRPDGSYRTFQFSHAKWADGKLVASFLCGPDNEVAYKGFAFVVNGQAKVWSSFKGDSSVATDLNTFLGLSTHDAAHEKFLELAEAFALKSDHCMRCGHKLTVPASLLRGLGPVCAGIEGVVTPAVAKKMQKEAKVTAPWKVAVETAGQTAGTNVFTPADERMMQAMEAWGDVLESYEFFDGEAEVRAEAARKFFKSFGLTAPVGA